MPRTTRTLKVSLLCAALLSLVTAAACEPVGGTSATTTTTAPAAPTSLVLVGHGFGHGRGMGQYGAYGMAVDHDWTGTAILNQFYGGTRTVAAPDVHELVDLTAQAGLDLTVINTLGRMTTSANGYATKFAALRIHRVDSSHFQLFTGTSCTGPWTAWAALHTESSIRLKPVVETTEDPRAMLQLCTPSGTRYYRGDLLADRVGSTIETVNDVDIENEVRSVIAREISPSWADAGGGHGAAAVRAQAVASRSYAESGDTRFTPWATTCDSTSCQVYSGYGTRAAGSSTIVKVEDPRTDKATSQTHLQVREFLSTGKIARTEFSSSSGGYSNPGDFPAAADIGDATSINPNHTWVATFSAATVAARFRPYGAHLTGTYEGVTVLTRNGYGDLGGRVLTVRVDFSDGSVTMSGVLFQQILGLRTYWFAVHVST